MVVVMLLAGILAGWVLGSAATRYGRARRDVVSAKSQWEKNVHTRNFERWTAFRWFAVIGVGVAAFVWMAIHDTSGF